MCARGIKFSDFQTTWKMMKFEEFINRMSVKDREKYLQEHGIILGKSYTGRFSAKDGRVYFSSIKNPFDGNELNARLINMQRKLIDQSEVKVRFGINLHTDTNGSTNNIFECIIVEDVDYRFSKDKKSLRWEEAHQYDGIQIVSRQKYEKEKHEAIKSFRAEDKEKSNRRKAEEKRRLDEFEHKGEFVDPEYQRRIKFNNRMFYMVLKKRNITKLVHFTRLENLDSILQYGILSVQKMENLNIIYQRNDENRFDHRLNCVSLSVEYPNIPYLRHCWDGEKKWVMLILDPELLLHYECYFAIHNASTISIARTIGKCNDINAFENMFADKIKVQLSDRPVIYERGTKLAKYPQLPTSPQAEILVRGVIEQKYIKHIIFEDAISQQRYMNREECKDIKLHNKKNLFITDRDSYYR